MKGMRRGSTDRVTEKTKKKKSWLDEREDVYISGAQRLELARNR